MDKSQRDPIEKPVKLTAAQKAAVTRRHAWLAEWEAREQKKALNAMLRGWFADRDHEGAVDHQGKVGALRIKTIAEYFGAIRDGSLEEY